MTGFFLSWHWVGCVPRSRRFSQNVLTSELPLVTDLLAPVLQQGKNLFRVGHHNRIEGPRLKVQAVAFGDQPIALAVADEPPMKSRLSVVNS
jgi:hypothetical protein